MEITRGKIPKAKKIVLYGPEGIGKSTFASQFDDPVFIDTEESTKEMDVARLPAPSSWQMVLEEVQYVRDHPDCCKTLVIDTADKAQQLAIDAVLAEKQFSSIEDAGYGKGCVYVYEKFADLMTHLDEVVDRGINVVITAHAAMRKFEQPDELGAYDRWELKLVSSKNCNASAMLREWSDMTLFANYKTHTVAEDKEGKKKKALGQGKRVMYTTHHSCWDAKNRYGLPDELPFEYDAIRHIFAENVQKSTESVKKQTESVKRTEKVTKPAEPSGKTSPPPDEEVSPKSTKEPEAKKAEPDAVPAAGGIEARLSPKIPKALRDLMIEKEVDEWQIQQVVSHRGYYPQDVKIWDYDQEFIDGCLVGAWDQVYKMIYEETLKPDPDNPFLIPEGEEEVPFK